jgi:hypothetical protein
MILKMRLRMATMTAGKMTVLTTSLATLFLIVVFAMVLFTFFFLLLTG